MWTQLEIAKNLLNDNIDVKKVMKYTGLSKQEIKELQKDDLKKKFICNFLKEIT